VTVTYVQPAGPIFSDIIYKMTNKMQQCRKIYCSLAALHVLSDVFTHHQEHLNCIYSLWYYTRESCWLVSWESWNLVHGRAGT